MWLYDTSKDYSKYTRKLVMVITDTDKRYRGYLLNICPPTYFDNPEKYQATIKISSPGIISYNYPYWPIPYHNITSDRIIKMFIDKTKYTHIKFKLFKTFIMNKTNPDIINEIFAFIAYDYEYI